LGDLWERDELLLEILEEMLRLVAAGTLQPVVDRAFPLDRAADAHTYIQDRKNFGKVLLTPLPAPFGSDTGSPTGPQRGARLPRQPER
jgi:hypothetical protein